MSLLGVEDWAAIVAAICAAIALIMNYAAIRQQTKAGDSTLYIAISDSFRERTAALMDAVGTEKERAALVDFLNFLETLASMLGESLLPRATRLMVRSILIEAISMIRANSCMHDVLMDSATSPLTYRYLVAFEKKHRRAIERQLRLFAKPGT